jgi:hypothetical protein
MAGVFLVHSAVNNAVMCESLFISLTPAFPFSIFLTLQKQILFGWVKYGRALQENIRTGFAHYFFFVLFSFQCLPLFNSHHRLQNLILLFTHV